MPQQTLCTIGWKVDAIRIERQDELLVTYTASRGPSGLCSRFLSTSLIAFTSASHVLSSTVSLHGDGHRPAAVTVPNLRMIEETGGSGG